MNRILTVLAVLSASVLLAGCPKKPTTVETPAGGEVVGGVTGAGTAGAGVGDSGAAQALPGADGADLDAAASGAATRILFDFDSSEIRPEYNATIAAHARRLSSGAALRVRLEGHTDERGSPEYNIGLGERRAQAVRRALMLQGAGDTQIITVSYGEERPAAEGESEEAWAQNRRVDDRVPRSGPLMALRARTAAAAPAGARRLAPALVLACAGGVGLGGCSLMEPQEDPAMVKAQQVEGRVAQVERQAQGMLDLQRQIEQLQADVRRLRGELEQAQFQSESARTQQRDLYADLDRRLQAVEARGAAPLAGAARRGVGDREAYQSALDALKSRDYARAEQVLREFPTRYPDSALLDNAKYWLGETLFVQRKYPEALQAFQRVVREHPDSARAPDALLKAGYAEYELKRYREARDFLNRVVKQHPDAPAAAGARERLARMDAEKR
jgi:peptidoglycan-associated lipoprotein/tol-pal system protein YbgF